MGRQESLTAWALGRGPYENEVIRTEGPVNEDNPQLYNSHGRPKNPETKRRDREMVQAANEVMQVTGVVEDMRAARAKIKAVNEEKLEETFTGLRYIEFGRPVLVAGVWGVLGLRRRILLYKQYSEIGFIDILRQEMAVKSIPSMLFTGIPTVVAYHLLDYAAFFAQVALESIFADDDDDDESAQSESSLRWTLSMIVDLGFYWMTLHFRLFSILQQLNLIPGSRLLPGFLSFFPFTRSSPIQLPPQPSLNARSLMSCGASLLQTLAPMLIIAVNGRLKHFASRLLYRPIYRSLPRPTGESIMKGSKTPHLTRLFDEPTNTDNTNTPTSREDTNEGHTPVRTEDEQTLRALEGLPAPDQDAREVSEEEGIRQLSLAMDRAETGENSEDEEEELMTATLVSFDVEATEAGHNSVGTWSAELRSANEPKPSKEVKYRVTGLTMLPTILATEGLKEIAAGIVTMPLEALMVRIIGRSFQGSASLDLSELYEVSLFHGLIPAAGNIFGALAIQAIFTGVVWAGYTYGVRQLTAKEKVQDADAKED